MVQCNSIDSCHGFPTSWIYARTIQDHPGFLVPRLTILEDKGSVLCAALFLQLAELAELAELALRLQTRGTMTVTMMPPVIS